MDESEEHPHPLGMDCKWITRCIDRVWLDKHRQQYRVPMLAEMADVRSARVYSRTLWTLTSASAGVGFACPIAQAV